uniref:Uncharacterized protein n=1 Tax=Geobacillus sp. (strain Y4.1MC1) TaxID=581103 RepID=A0A7U3YHU5_GEOS0
MTTKNLKSVVLREEFSMLTGHYIRALALNQFIYWETYTKDAELYREEEKQRFHNENESNGELPKYGWIYKTAKDLAGELLLSVHETTIRRHLKFLEERGYLFKRTNSRYKWDKTYQYRVNLVKVVKDLERLGYPIKHYEWFTSSEDHKENPRSDQDHPSGKESTGSKRRDTVSDMHDAASGVHDAGSKMLHAGAIPEITTEITSKKEDEEAPRFLDNQTIEKTVNEIAKYFKELSGKKYVSNADKECIRCVVEQGWPKKQVLQWMADCFEQFMLRHPRDQIRTFKYVANYLFDQAYQAGLLKKNDQGGSNDAKQTRKFGGNSQRDNDSNWYEQLQQQFAENEKWRTELECDF